MNKKIIFAGIFVSIFLILGISFAAAKFNTLQYDASITIDDKAPIKVKYYYKDGAMRMDAQLLDREVTTYFKGKKVYMYIPGSDCIVETSVVKALMQPPLIKDYKKDFGELKYLGQEFIGKDNCDIYEYIAKKDANGKLWVSKATDFPVKIEYLIRGEKTTVYIDNIVSGAKVRDSLFVIPSGLEIIDP